MAARVRWAGMLLVVLLVVVLVVACAPMAVDEGRAREAATEFVTTLSPPGTVMRDIRVTSVRQELRGAAPGWVVEAEGTPARADEAASVTYYYILFIDGLTGEVTIEAQG